MRDLFREELAGIEQAVVADLQLAAATLAVIARVVADTSSPTPSSIEAAAEVLKEGARAADSRLLTTMARQAPVAGDLRVTMCIRPTTRA